jgi:hypothetical protein
MGSGKYRVNFRDGNETTAYTQTTSKTPSMPPVETARK